MDFLLVFFGFTTFEGFRAFVSLVNAIATAQPSSNVAVLWQGQKNLFKNLDASSMWILVADAPERLKSLFATTRSLGFCTRQAKLSTCDYAFSLRMFSGNGSLSTLIQVAGEISLKTLIKPKHQNQISSTHARRNEREVIQARRLKGFHVHFTCRGIHSWLPKCQYNFKTSSCISSLPTRSYMQIITGNG